MMFNRQQLKNERLWLLLLFIGGLVWIFSSFLSNVSFPDTSYNFLGTTNKVKLDSGKPVTQHFIAKENNLDQVKVVLENTGLQWEEKIDFELMDSACETTLAKDTYGSYDVSPFIYYRLTFPTISDSAGQTYCFKVTYFSPIDRGNDRPYLGASEEEQFVGQSYTNEGNNRTYENRSLQMRPNYGSGSFLGDLGRLNDRISQYKPEFVKGNTLTLLFSIFLIGTVAFILLLVLRKEE